MTMKLQGKNIVIIGGSSGVGFETARLALEQGANVTIASRSSERLERAKSNLMGNVKIAVADVSDEVSIQNIFEKHNRVDHVFLPGSTRTLGKILDTHPDKFRQSLEERIFGPLYVVRAAVPKMPKSGSITLVSSINVNRLLPGRTMVAVAAAAVQKLTHCLALELASYSSKCSFFRLGRYPCCS